MGGAGSTDIAALKFLEFLDAGRSVLLQDVALLMCWYPDHPLWDAPGAGVFRTATFRHFQSQVLAECEASRGQEINNFATVGLT